MGAPFNPRNKRPGGSGGGFKKPFKPAFKKEYLTPEQKELINELTKEVKDINQKISDSERNFTNKESEFREDSLNKQIELFLPDDKSVSGKLLDIEKYRIKIEIDGVDKYFYKHALLGYALAE